MNLQLLQTNLCALIKSRECELPKDAYLNKISTSNNLVLIKKIALWWRQIQIESFCQLTSNLLKANGLFEDAIAAFFNNTAYSSFREEIGIQFLEFIAQKNISPLTQCVAKFEFAIIQVKLNKKIAESFIWHFEPYTIIDALMNNTFNNETLIPGKYLVKVSYKDELFCVEDLNNQFELN